MLWTHHRSRPLSLIYDIIACCPSGCDRLLFFSFPLCALDKRTFCHSLLATLYPAPLLPLDNNGSIAWSVRVLVQYIKTNTWPSKLQSSLLGYFPGLYETTTGDTDAPSRHFHASLLPLSLSPHLASAPAVSFDSQLHQSGSGVRVLQRRGLSRGGLGGWEMVGIRRLYWIVGLEGS